jgi:tetratricopeptide (TPR) repeat protein
LQVPQLGTLDQLCKAFGLSPEELGFEQAIAIKRRTIRKAPSSPQSLSQPATLIPQSTQAVMDTERTPASLSMPDHSSTSYKSATYDIAHRLLDYEICQQQTKRSLIQMNIHQQKREGAFGLSRRQAIAALIGAPAAVFGVTGTAREKLLHPEEVVALSTVNIPLTWRLYFEGGLTEVTRIIPSYLSRLSTLAEQPSPYQQKAAFLASQAYQLASLLTLQYQNYGTALTYARQAFSYGKEVQDPNLQATSLIRQAQVYLYLKRPQQRLLVYQQAMQYANHISPLLQGRIYIGLTEVHSKLNHRREAEHFLDTAHRTFPANFEEDPNFSYTHFNLWSLTALEGLMYVNLDQPQRAWVAFEHIDITLPEETVPNRVELLVRQAGTSFALGDLEQTSIYTRRALSAAAAAGNQLRRDEVNQIYERMQMKWGHEPEVKDLAELFK